MDMSKLDGLEDLVREVDAEGPPTAQQQQEQAVEAAGEENARQWGAIVYMLGNAAAMIAPELRQIYTEDACLNWGRAMNPVAEKYGWNGPAAIPELGLAIATAGLVVPSFFAIRARVQAVNKGEEKTSWLASMREWWLSRKKKATPPSSPIDGVTTGAAA
jgi:hypothetical protein